MLTAKKKIQLAFLLAMAVSLALFFSAGFLRKNAYKSEEIAEDLGPGVSVEARDIHITRDRWEIWLQKARRMDKGDKTTCDEVKLLYHTDDGRELTLTGEKGDWDQKKMDLEVEGNVVVTATGGYTLKTGWARYNSAKNAITGHGPVNITGPGFEVTGRAMRVDLDTQLFVLEKDVTTRVEKSRTVPNVGG